MIVEHHIQRQILRELVKGEAKRFSEIKPKAVESNLFMYHLRQLIRGGLVAKDNESSKYTLTKEGRLYADRSNLPTMKLRLQPKQITVLVVRNKKVSIFYSNERTYRILTLLVFRLGRFTTAKN